MAFRGCNMPAHDLERRIWGLLAKVLSSGYKVNMQRAPSHCGIRGNEYVDEMAAIGTMQSQRQ